MSPQRPQGVWQRVPLTPAQALQQAEAEARRTAPMAAVLIPSHLDKPTRDAIEKATGATALFDKWCPVDLVMGVRKDAVWRDPELAEARRKQA